MTLCFNVTAGRVAPVFLQVDTVENTRPVQQQADRDPFCLTVPHQPSPTRRRWSELTVYHTLETKLRVR